MKNSSITPLALALLAITLLIAPGCGKSPSAGAQVDGLFRSSIPPATKALLSIQVAKLEATDLYNRHRQEFDLPQVDAMAERLGLDAHRDLAEVLVAWDGAHAITMARGGFKADRMEEKLRGMGTQHATYKNYTLFGAPQNSVAFLDGGLALAGPADGLQATLDLRSSGAGAVPEELLERLRAVPADSQIWAVSRGGLPLAGLPLSSDMESALSNIVDYISATSFGVGVDSGARLSAEIVCNSNEGALRVHDAMRGLIGLARLSTKDNEIDLLRMWDAVSIDKDHQVIHVRANLPADLTDKLLEHLPGLRHRAGAVLRSH